MQDQTPQSTEDKTCGCNCEMCMKGEHKQCQTGMCTLMTTGGDSSAE